MRCMVKNDDGRVLCRVNKRKKGLVNKKVINAGIDLMDSGVIGEIFSIRVTETPVIDAANLIHKS